jgi:succinate-acetate transporter protein
VRPEGLGKLEKNPPHRDSNPQPFGLQHSALTTTLIRLMKSRRIRWAGHVARMGETGNAYRILVGKPEGKGPLGRPRRR